MWQKLERCDFLEHYKYDKCQSLHRGSAHLAVPLHTTFSDRGCISAKQQCQTHITETFMFLFD